jgi:DNA invertase Pin-like site-specific DNA recombinase
MKVAIYARVSTKQRAECPVCGKTIKLLENRPVEHLDRLYNICAGIGQLIEETADRGQDTENQLIQLREYCTRQGWVIVAEYADRVSGKSANRDAFKQLFEDASKRNFDVVLVWALDRFTREGVYETFDHVHRLASHGIQFESYTEAHFRTTGPAGELMLAVAAWIAKQERQRISDRTKAGLERAKRAGKKCGRPVRVFRRDEATALRAKGMSWRAIGQKLGVPYATIRRALEHPKIAA